LRLLQWVLEHERTQKRRTDTLLTEKRGRTETKLDALKPAILRDLDGLVDGRGHRDNIVRCALRGDDGTERRCCGRRRIGLTWRESKRKEGSEQERDRGEDDNSRESQRLAEHKSSDCMVGKWHELRELCASHLRGPAEAPKPAAAKGAAACR
jgi:hypothetical protein